MAEYITKDKLWDKFVDEPFYDNADKDEIVLPIIDSFPAADVAPVVHGRWVHDGRRFKSGVDWCHCSECGGMNNFAARTNYCPNCGAKMDGGADDGT